MHDDERSKVLLDVIEPLKAILAGMSDEAKQFLADELAKLMPMGTKAAVEPAKSTGKHERRDKVD